MQPAEKTYYRKGLALGLTMAEIFSIIVFILLLLCGILLEQKSKELEDVRADFIIAKSLTETQDPLVFNDINWLDTYRTLRDSLDKVMKRVESLRNDSLRMRAENESLLNSLQSAEYRSQLSEKVAMYKGQLEVLADSLNQTAELLRNYEHRYRELEDLLRKLETDYMAAMSKLERIIHLDSIQIVEHLQQTIRVDSLEKALNEARDIISNFYNLETFNNSLKNISSEDSLQTVAINEKKRSEAYRNQVLRITRDFEDAVSRITSLIEQVNQLTGGQGIDPPPCWLSQDRRPEYILRIELTNNGFQLFKVAPPHRNNDDVMSYLAEIEHGSEYTPDEFLARTRSIYYEGRSRTSLYGPGGCRFWIRPIDRTGSSKEVFQRREAELGRHFWYRW